MKTLLFTIATLFVCTSVHAQGLTVKANFTVNTITDFDEGFIGGGIGAEGAVGRRWSVGSDFTWSKSEDIKLFHFNPAMRYYFRRSLQGFYLGIGASVHRLERDNNVPIGFPLDIDRGATAIIGGPEMQLGMQTRIYNQVTMGIKAGLVLFTDYDLDENAGINVNFTVGWLFN